MTDTEEYVMTDTEEYVITDTDTLFKVVGHYGPPPALIRVKMRKIFQHFYNSKNINTCFLNFKRISNKPITDGNFI